MLFFDLLAIVFFILLAPIPLVSGIFQYNPQWFRRFGNWNYVVTLNIYILVMLSLFNYLPLIITLRAPLARPLAIIGVLFLAVGSIVAVLAGRTLTLRTLISLPQIYPERYQQKLITNGLYRVIRHPRYVGYWLMALGFAMITSLILMWAFFFWLVIGLCVLAFLEERELQKRFGKEYERYIQRVPAFIPKFF